MIERMHGRDMPPMGLFVARLGPDPFREIARRLKRLDDSVQLRSMARILLFVIELGQEFMRQFIRYIAYCRGCRVDRDKRVAKQVAQSENFRRRRLRSMVRQRP
jgi:hypothetical protein